MAASSCCARRLFLLALCWGVWSASAARRPAAPVVVQALRPRGLRISVPDVPGMSVVIINANINLPIAQNDTGKVSGNVLEPKDKYWTLEEKDVTLKPGDIVFYWVYFVLDNNGDRVSGHQGIHDLVEPSCGPSATTFNGRAACAGQLIFEDNFDSFNTSVWKHSIQLSDEPNIDFAIYDDHPENSFVKDGRLHLKATVLNEDELLVPTKLKKCTWPRGEALYCEKQPIGWDILPPTRSALLTTRGTFSFKFGRIDIRAKAAVGNWLLSRLMLEPQTDAYGGNVYESGRVELMRVRGNDDVGVRNSEWDPPDFYFGADLNTPQSVISTCSRTQYYYKHCRLTGELYSGKMHLFSVMWTPNFITIIIDDNCENKLTPPDGGFLESNYFKNKCNSPWERGTTMAPFDREFYVQLSLRPGGFHNFYDGAKTNGITKPWTDNDPRGKLTFWKERKDWLPTWKSDMEVDYVKVWAL